MKRRLTWPVSLNGGKEVFLWIGAGLISFLCCLLLTFPYRTLQSRLLFELSNGTGWDVRATEWSVGFPMAIEWRDVVFSKPGSAAISVESLRVALGLIARLTGEQKFDGVLQFPGSPQGHGRVSATVTATSSSFRGPAALKARAQQVDLAPLIKPYVSKGILQADVIQHWSGTDEGGIQFKGDGSWKAEIRDLVIERVPIGPATLPSLTFNRVNLVLACRDATCEVTDGKGDGPDGSITVQGQLRLQQPVQQTNLELSITVQAGSGWAQKSAGLPFPPLLPGTPLTFKLVGSVANPRLSV